MSVQYNAVKKYAAEHLRVAVGARTHLHAIRAHFRVTTQIEEGVLHDYEFNKMLRAVSLNMGSHWKQHVAYSNISINYSRQAMGYGNVVLAHLPVDAAVAGNPVFDRATAVAGSPVFDRGTAVAGSPVFDGETTVRAYVMRHLRTAPGVEIHLHAVRTHFRSTEVCSVSQLSDRAFNKLLRVAILDKLGALSGVAYRNKKLKGKPKCMMYVNMGIVSRSAYAVHTKPLPTSPATFTPPPHSDYAALACIPRPVSPGTFAFPSL